MNILLIGYGKMGKGIESLARERGHNIVAIVDFEDAHLLESEDFFKKFQPDLAIEFSTPESAWSNIKACLTHGIPTLSGTTGWTHHWSDLETLQQATQGSFFYTANYSIGVNIFFSINQQLAKLMGGLPEYKLTMEEIHHIHKKDHPSGTALALAKDIMTFHSGYNSWTVETETSLPHEIPIQCIRQGEVPGTHTVNYVDEHDRITIVHEAFSRSGFIQGVLIAAEWLNKINKPGIYDMRDVLK